VNGEPDETFWVFVIFFFLVGEWVDLVVEEFFCFLFRLFSRVLFFTLIPVLGSRMGAFTALEHFAVSVLCTSVRVATPPPPPLVAAAPRHHHSDTFERQSSSSNCCCYMRNWRPRKRFQARRVQALVIEPSGNAEDSTADFVKRMEQTWLISKQPRPVQCASCDASGSKDCVWCKGTGFFFLGDQMLCEVPSRNTLCVICGGKGMVPCKDCKGTGFRARWLGQTPEVSGS
jgi:hypothetical protein